jgi:tripartite-type tricarboxylate transporter receptor subunit TctC
MGGKQRWIARLLAALLAAHLGAAVAQPYPTKPIRLVVGFPPGGGVDINARLLAPKLTEFLGQPVIVENRPGAGTNIANELVARSAPDGYTLLINTPAVAINMALYRKLPYDTLRDLAAVSIFSEAPNILVVHNGVAARDVQALVALARAKPGTLNYSSAGSGTTQHLAGELLKLRTGTDIVHVPYKGSAPSLTSLVAGEVDMSFANIPAIFQHIKAGRLRPLASTGAKRAELMPDVPTMKEAGIDVEVTVWYAVLAPAATPKEIVGTLANAIAKAARSPDIRQRLLDQGAEPVGSTSQEFDRVLRAEVAKWQEVIGAAGIRAD